MRHVSRTLRVALHWLFDRINLDSKIQIKYVDTKHQLADILTKRNFTRDEWSNLLHLFNISDCSLICCSQNFSLTSCSETMSNRVQKGEGRIVAKSKPTLNLASLLSTNSSTVQSPIASKSAGILRAPCQNDWTSTGRLGAREFNQDPASSSQRWKKDAVLDVVTRKLVATEEDQEHLKFCDGSKNTRRLVASGNSDTKGKGYFDHLIHNCLQTAYRTWRRFSR